MGDTLVLGPILLPLAGAAGALLLARRDRARWIVALAAMVGAAISSLWLLASVSRTGRPLVYQLGDWPAPFGITLVADLLAALMAVMCQVVLVLGLLYAVGSRDKVATFWPFPVLFLTLATGLTGAMLTGDLFTLFVFTEVLVFSGTALTASADDRHGTEAAFKYFYMSTLASTCLLLAIGTLYVAYGTVNMADLALRIGRQPDLPLAWVALALLTAAFMVKCAAFPLHFWQPDFHTASPTAVSAMLSSVVVKLGLYGFLRLTTLLFVTQAPNLRGFLLVVGMAGVVYGGLGALGTHNAKRMLAYSTLAQVGFMLVAVGWGTPLALAAALIFAFNHSLVKSAMLMLAGYLASRAPVKTADFAVVTGLGRQMAPAGVLFFIGGMALAGIPPTNGFVSKLALFQSGLAAERYASVALIGIASILTLLYVARAFQRIWWQPGEGDERIKERGDALWAPAILIVIVLGLGLWPEPLVGMAGAAAAWMLTPELYIMTVLGP